MDAISKKRPQPKKELMKLVKDEIQLRSPKFNAAVFIDLVKERVCDWIIEHGVRPVKQDKILVSNVTFDPTGKMCALAEYHVSPWNKGIVFYTYFNWDKNQFLTHVFDCYAPGSALTINWDGLTHLAFDEYGRSYEVTRQEKQVIKINSYKRLKKKQPEDLIFKCQKCRNKFAANDLDIWIDGGLNCPVCGAKSTDIQYIGKATENG